MKLEQLLDFIVIPYIEEYKNNINIKNWDKVNIWAQKNSWFLHKMEEIQDFPHLYYGQEYNKNYISLTIPWNIPTFPYKQIKLDRYGIPEVILSSIKPSGLRSFFKNGY